ncbi:MAG: hypothetical protein JJE53_01165 [Candidatus Pacebacteria bacterium]|nr:hypothetical protein [Candidatus Paceibacterota bacterium]
MLDKIKRLAGVVLVIFCLISFIIFIMMTWDIMSRELAVEAFTKVSYTFGSILVVSLIILLVSKILGEKQ